MTNGPFELDATGTKIFASEAEAGEATPYRPRRELARLSVDDVELAKFIVLAMNNHADLLKILIARAACPPGHSQKG